MRSSTLTCLHLLAALLLPMFLCAQNSQSADKTLKGLKAELKSATGTARVDVLLKISPFYIDRTGFAISNLDSATAFAKEALELSKKNNYVKGVRESSFLLGKSYIKSHNYSELTGLMENCEESTWALLVVERVKQETVFEDLDLSHYDSLVALVKRAIDIGSRTKDAEITSMSFLQYSNLLFDTGDIIKGREFFKQALSSARAAGSLEGEAEIFSQTTGSLYDDKSIFPELLAMGDKIKTVFATLPDDEFKVNVERLLVMGYDQISYYQIYGGNMHDALSTALQSVALLEKSGNPNLIDAPYQTLGKIYLETGDFEKCIDYLRMSRAIAWKKGAVLFAPTTRNVVRAYIALGKVEQGLQFIAESLEHGGYDDLFSKRVIAECYASCYVALGQYETAEKYYLEAYAVQEKLVPGTDRRLSLHIPIARLYMQMGQYRKAEGYLVALLEESHRSKIPGNVQRDAYYLLFRVDSLLGNSDRAMANLYAYQSLNDSLFNERKNQQIEELTVKYETDKKDRDLDILRKQSDLQEADLRNAGLYRNGLIGGTVVLIMFLVLVYSRYRLKQKTTRLLETSQERISQNNIELHKLNDEQQKLLGEKEWLVKEIHHRVKNNLQIVISLLRTQAEHLKEGDALSAIHESESRLQVISLLHQKLYKVDTDSVIDMETYVPDLVNCVREGINAGSQLVFDVKVDKIKLDISQAVPVGLILNEAITNVIKYAYPKGQRGNVHVYLQNRADGSILLSVADNGRGLAQNFDYHNVSSMGMKLMETLAEQLEGSMDLRSNGGTTLEIVFALNRVQAQSGIERITAATQTV